jgi:hypothetical protein
MVRVSESNSKPRATLSGLDFTLPPAPKDQAIMLGFGVAGHGKTTFGLLHAPGPVAFFDIDRRGLHAAKKATNAGKEIHYLAVDFPKGLNKLTPQQVIQITTKSTDNVRRNFDGALERSLKGDIRTIVFDTMTEYAEILNMKFTGHNNRNKSDYGKSAGLVKAELSQMIKSTRESNANLIMLARAKEVWEGGEPSGKYTYRGPDTMEFDADWAAHIRIQKRRSIKDRGKEPKFEMEVTKAGIDIEALGNVYTEDDWGELGPFVWGCMENYPGTDPETWE